MANQELLKLSKDQLIKVAAELEERLLTKMAAETFFQIGSDLADEMAKSAAVPAWLGSIGKSLATAGKAVGNVAQQTGAELTSVGRSAAAGYRGTPGVGKGIVEGAKAGLRQLGQSPKAVMALGGTAAAGAFAAGRMSKKGK